MSAKEIPKMVSFLFFRSKIQNNRKERIERRKIYGYTDNRMR